MGFYRCLKIKNEMTQYYATLDQEVDFYIKVRVRRRPQHLPNSWDGYLRSLHNKSNWKLYRKHQWR